MKHILKILTLVATSTCGLCMIDGMTYMDPINFRKYQNNWPRGEDPCNPLYWYPRNIPEYCKFRKAPFDFDSKMLPQPPLVPLPVPAPLPPPLPLLAPLSYPLPPPLPLPPPALSMPEQHQPPILPPPPQMPMPLLQMPGPMAPIPSLPFGTPIIPTNPMVPSASLPYPYLPPNYPMYNHPTQLGMIPGVPGMVSRDGGINIMPFSDVYSDLMEDHKWKMMKKHMSYCPLYRRRTRH